MTAPPRVFGYRPCICDHETHRKRAKKWRYNANQAYHKMVASPLFRLTVKVDIDALREDLQLSLEQQVELEDKLKEENDEIIKLNEEVTKQANNNTYITETINHQDADRSIADNEQEVGRGGAAARLGARSGAAGAKGNKDHLSGATRMS